MKRKRLLISLLIILLLSGAVAAGIYYYWFSKRLSYSGTLIQNVSRQVVITRDTRGVPEITCSNYDDFYYALGRLHAMDRLYGVTFLRNLTNGNAHRVINEGGETINRLVASLNLKVVSKDILNDLSPEQKNYIISYCSGMNDYIIGSSDIPREYRNEWSPENVLSIFLFKQWISSFLENRENIFQVSQRNRYIESFRLLPRNMTLYYRDTDKESIEMIRWLTRLMRKIDAPLFQGYAMFLPGKHTSDETPVTLFGYDVTTMEYPGYYPVMASINNRKYRGMTFNGIPFFLGGDTEKYTYWGFNLKADVMDFVKYKVKNIDNSILFYSPYGWKKVEDVKGSSNYTINGNPVLNEVVGVGKYRGSVVALSYTFPGSDFVRSLFDIAQAENSMKARQAVRYIHSQPRVYLFTDVSEGIRVYSGKLPQRALPFVGLYPGEQYTPRVSADLSYYTTRRRTFLAAGSDYYDGLPGFYKQYLHPQGIRYDEVEKELKLAVNYSEREVRKLLNRRKSYHAEKFIPIFVKILKHNLVTSGRLMRIYFSNWDFNMEKDKVSPTLYNWLLRNYMYYTLHDELGGDIEGVRDHLGILTDAFYELSEKNVSRLFDNRLTEKVENRDDIFNRAFLKTLKDLNRKAGPEMDNWKWGIVNRYRFPIKGAHKNILKNFFVKIPLREMDGGYSAFKQIKLFNGLTPGIFQGVSGYTSLSLGSVEMSFTVSTDENSKFYYGSDSFYDDYHDIQQHDVIEKRILNPPGN